MFSKFEQKQLRDIKSQQEYINHIPVEEMMTWQSWKINPFDQLDDLKYLASTREAKEVLWG